MGLVMIAEKTKAISDYPATSKLYDELDEGQEEDDTALPALDNGGAASADDRTKEDEDQGSDAEENDEEPNDDVGEMLPSCTLTAPKNK